MEHLLMAGPHVVAFGAWLSSHVLTVFAVQSLIFTDLQSAELSGPGPTIGTTMAALAEFTSSRPDCGQEFKDYQSGKGGVLTGD